MKRLSVFLALVLWGVILSAHAATKEPSCPVCHGSDWSGNSKLHTPNLSILPAWYIQQQLTGFQQGWRRQSEADLTDDMIAVARQLSEKDVAAALKVLAKQAPIAKVGVVAGDVSVGENLYQVCSACHGDSGEGKETLHAPPLAGQSALYLRAQLNAFGSGHRGAAATDTSGQQMAAGMTWPLSTEQLDALLAFIATFTLVDH